MIGIRLVVRGCCNYARYNSTLLLRTIFLSGESTLLVEGTMARRKAVRRHNDKNRVPWAANDQAPPAGTATEEGTARRPPANDNPTLDGLPACLPVTDEEVRLLHRYLGAQILGPFA